MKFFYILLFTILLLANNKVQAGIKVRYGSCVGSCSCPAPQLEKDKNHENMAVFEIPSYPVYSKFMSFFNVTYKDSSKTIEFVEIDDFSAYHDELAYPINVDDNSYNVTDCAYVLLREFNDGSCSFQFMCNDYSSSPNSSNKILISYLVLAISLILVVLI